MTLKLNTNFIFKKCLISINIIDIAVSSKFPFVKQDFKYFIGYKDSEKIRPL